MTEDEMNQQKEIVYYQTLLSAYSENSFEKDRSLLTLSGGAIGLLITLLTTVGVSSSAELVLYILTFLFFGICIVLLLYVFNLDKAYLLKIANKEVIDDKKLIIFDHAIFILFLVGIVLFSSIGIVAGINQINKKEQIIMSKESSKRPVDESLQGLNKMLPDSDCKKSLQGLNKLEPPATSPQPSQPKTTTTTNSGTNSGTSSNDKK
jgi:hypothetical protein